MNRRTILQSSVALAGLALVPGCATSGPAQGTAMSVPPPPMPRREPRTITQLGRTRVDDYAWMKDDNWQAVLRDPSLIRADIRDHLLIENAYTKALLAPTEALQAQLFEEMKGRIKEDDASVPDADGPWEYYTRYNLGAQHPVYARRPRGRTDGEQILLDADALAQGKDYSEVGAAEHSPDHRYYACAEDAQGSEYYTIRIRDLTTGQDLPEPIESAYGTFTFSPDSQYLFWVFRDEEGRPKRLFRRPVRGGRAADVLVYEEADDGFFMGVGVVESKAYIVISTGNQEQSETRLIPAATPTATPVVFHPRTPALRYDVTHWDGKWFIRTNADGATDFKVMTCLEGQTGKANWRDDRPYEAGRFVEGLTAVKDWLVRLERVNALQSIVLRNRLTGAEHTISQEEAAYALSLDGGYEWDTGTVRYVYTSPTTPRQWIDYDLAARTKTVRKTQEIPSGHNPANYVAQRIFARASDGAQVPITILMKRGTPLDGSAPLMLYGYGSYGIPMEASFSIRTLSLVDRGWIWAIAHVRGGSEKGWAWFQDGRKFSKKNTFTDFIACAEHLIGAGYGTAGKIVAYGGSAGGLLVGAVTNMRPDLWAGVIGAVPFVDVINTMSDTSLPLTPPEWPEWGNPIEDPAAYDYMISYSPYDQVAPRPYPAVLATGGLSDPRVTYWEPMKWAAKLRATTTSDNPILLRINMEAGHGGASGRFDFLKEIALDYAFAMKAVGAAEAGGPFPPVVNQA